MKKILLAIWKFFLSIWKFFFGEEAKELHDESPTGRVSNKTTIPSHNNRRITRGRFIQYINVGEGRQRAIYHGAK